MFISHNKMRPNEQQEEGKRSKKMRGIFNI